MAPGPQNETEQVPLNNAAKPEEEEPFLVETTKVDLDAPKDKYNAVYLIMLLHGIGCLMPWNMFITIAPSYFVNYKMMENINGTLHPTPYSLNFFSYLGIFSQLPNLALNFINIFVRLRGGLAPRIGISLVIVGVICVFTMIMIFVDSSAWVFGFFVITMISVAILNGANGVYQNSIYGVVADFPPHFTNAIILGNNLCGTFVTIVSMLTIVFIKDTQLAAFLYFSIALLTIVACFVTFFMLNRFEFYVYYAQKAQSSKGEEAEPEEEEVITVQRYTEVFKQGKMQMYNVFCVFFVTLTIFPAIMAEVKLYREDGKYDFFIPEKLFTTFTCFLLFNVFATIGSTLANFVQWPNPQTLWIPVTLRLLLIPAFMFCNYRPESRSWPVYIDGEWIFILLGIVMSITSGYFSSLAMMYAPRVVEEKNSRIAGMMAAFFLIFGICCGIVNTFFIAYFIDSLGR